MGVLLGAEEVTPLQGETKATRIPGKEKPPPKQGQGPRISELFLFRQWLRGENEGTIHASVEWNCVFRLTERGFPTATSTIVDAALFMVRLDALNMSAVQAFVIAIVHFFHIVLLTASHCTS